MRVAVGIESVLEEGVPPGWGSWTGGPTSGDPTCRCHPRADCRCHRHALGNVTALALFAG